VGYSTQVLYATFMNMALVVAGIVIFLVFPLSYGGFVLLKKQLEPLESIASQAKKMTTHASLSRRISLESPTKELESIQSALNTMLSQLEHVFTREREFFADAAHTLKTPLAVLRSQIENSALRQKSQSELLSIIDTTNDTIQDLLFLTKVGTHKPSTATFSLSHLLENLAEIATALGEEKNLKVRSQIQTDVVISGDQKLIQRALSNLIHNAVLYNKPNGTIDISLTTSNTKIKISISDTGIGIKKTDQEKVFSRFYRGKNNIQPGSGLGLAITKAVIHDLGGRIALHSKSNKGTNAVITIPR
jgi:signal transduction histidine kinase